MRLPVMVIWRCYLPPSGHYHGIPHIIGDKLTVIGGCLSATDKRTNKVSTFDDGSQTWISYYPDLLSVRSTPGVVIVIRSMSLFLVENLKMLAHYKMILKFSTGLKIPIGEEHQLSFLGQCMGLLQSYLMITCS